MGNDKTAKIEGIGTIEIQRRSIQNRYLRMFIMFHSLPIIS